jgi:hypothetical protein
MRLYLSQRNGTPTQRSGTPEPQNITGLCQVRTNLFNGVFQLRLIETCRSKYLLQFTAREYLSSPQELTYRNQSSPVSISVSLQCWQNQPAFLPWQRTWRFLHLVWPSAREEADLQELSCTLQASIGKGIEKVRHHVNNARVNRGVKWRVKIKLSP